MVSSSRTASRSSGRKLPAQVLLANPGLLHLLPEAEQRDALLSIPRLAERYAATFEVEASEQLSLDLTPSAEEEDVRAA